jgi:cytoskeletal protein CcmA (bactofilin family)
MTRFRRDSVALDPHKKESPPPFTDGTNRRNGPEVADSNEPVRWPEPPPGSVLGPQTRFRGEVRGAGPLRVRGQLEGSVRIQGQFVVEVEGRVVAEIETDHAVLRGRADGELRAVGSVRLENPATFKGDITAGRIQVDTGAVLEGRILVPETP